MADHLAETKRDVSATPPLADNPFASLPAGWVPAVTFFAAAKAVLVRSPVALCVNLRYWIAKGLTLEDAKVCFRRLCDPEVARRHEFESQLMAELAGLVADAIKRRKAMEEMIRRRNPQPADVEVFKLADAFGMPGKGR